MISLHLLRCPRCRSALENGAAGEHEDDAIPGPLRCVGCDAEYDVRMGIPDLTPPEIADDPAWATWQQHLVAFAQRRELRVSEPGGLPNRLSISGRPQQRAFADFTGITDGVVLDIGCGPGKFSKHLPDAVRYVGLDPIPIPDGPGIEMVRGLAEHLPFDDGSIDHITVLSALDHFNDVPAFMGEARRVLGAGGRMHVIQQVHEPSWSVRGVAHAVKDFVEDRRTKHEVDVPHHMTEFHESDLRAAFERDFTIVDEQIFSASPLAPRRWFLSLAPKEPSAE